jgi:hypothetical protein
VKYLFLIIMLFLVGCPSTKDALELQYRSELNLVDVSCLRQMQDSENRYYQKIDFLTILAISGLQFHHGLDTDENARKVIGDIITSVHAECYRNGVEELWWSRGKQKGAL